MESNENIWAKIVSKLIEKKLTIATMESCTGGGVANEITNISGASSVLKESYVTYCNEAKIKQGVSKEIIAEFTVYSFQTAVEMANAVKKQAHSDIGIGVTGQLGRIDPANPIGSRNCVWFAIVDQNDNVYAGQKFVPDDERRAQKDFVIDEIATALYEQIC